MKQVLLDCQSCGNRRLQELDEKQANNLRLDFECWINCESCGKPTTWAFSANDRREGRDRRDYPRPVVEEMPEISPLELERPVSLSRNPSHEAYHQLAQEKRETQLAQEKRETEERRTAAQRTQKRLPLSLPVRVRVVEPYRTFHEVTQTQDVSRGGILIYSDKSYKVGDSVMVALNYSAGVAGSDLEQSGKVVRMVPLPFEGKQSIAIQMGKTAPTF
jgi:Tfp pilus assembly protein PilZ